MPLMVPGRRNRVRGLSDGFAGFSHMFAMQSGMGVKWDALDN